MKISCICPTYNRVPHHQHLLEEAIESFIKQDYPANQRELLILNDNREQTLTCDAPGVIVINTPCRFKSLGEKYNALVAMASGDLLAPWEDDDISLPWRLSLSIRELAMSGASYYNPRRFWLYRDKRYQHKHPHGVGHACSVYTRRAFELVNGYAFISGAQDMNMDSRLTNTVKTTGSPNNSCPQLDIAKWFYIYRWDTGSIHLSSDSRNCYYAEIANSKHKPGVYNLQPRWLSDYTQIITDLLCNTT